MRINVLSRALLALLFSGCAWPLAAHAQTLPDSITVAVLAQRRCEMPIVVDSLQARTPNPTIRVGSSQSSDARKVDTPALRVDTIHPLDTVTVYAADRAVFIIRPNGDVLLRPTTSIDEDDRIEVRIMGDSNLLNYLTVVRQSAFGLPDSIAIAGSGTHVETQFGGDPVRGTVPPCDVITRTLYDFAPGQATVGVVAATSSGPRTIATFDFGVRRLYTGGLSLAFVRSAVRNPTYGLTPVSTNSDSVITISKGNNPTSFFAVFYTPYVLGRHDFQKLTGSLLNYINPTFGLTLNDFGKNAMLGLSAEIPRAGVSIMVGAHAGRANRINPDSRYHVGDVFSGGADNIPVQEYWSVRRFVAVGVDLRAAVQFLGAASGVGKPKG